MRFRLNWYKCTNVLRLRLIFTEKDNLPRTAQIQLDELLVRMNLPARKSCQLTAISTAQSTSDKLLSKATSTTEFETFSSQFVSFRHKTASETFFGQHCDPFRSVCGLREVRTASFVNIIRSTFTKNLKKELWHLYIYFHFRKVSCSLLAKGWFAIKEQSKRIFWCVELQNIFGMDTRKNRKGDSHWVQKQKISQGKAVWTCCSCDDYEKVNICVLF